MFIYLAEVSFICSFGEIQIRVSHVAVVYRGPHTTETGSLSLLALRMTLA